MKIDKYTKASFVVIGKEGTTSDGQGFIQKLWADANSHFSEVQSLAKIDENGNLAGIWGAMSDCSHLYKPWEDHFSKGLYLAGVECVDGAEAPDGWTKWVIPGFEYLRAEVESECKQYPPGRCCARFHPPVDRKELYAFPHQNNLINPKISATHKYRASFFRMLFYHLRAQITDWRIFKANFLPLCYIGITQEVI